MPRRGIPRIIRSRPIVADLAERNNVPLLVISATSSASVFLSNLTLGRKHPQDPEALVFLSSCTRRRFLSPSEHSWLQRAPWKVAFIVPFEWDAEALAFCTKSA